ncbi:uncharacterized protein LOC131298349 [Rhododendron vialii]|uniref:uncharacterized protein LOC131298349 n=1 Tax=Rhododendron vialii TaxID=182163 RepID=UPI00265E2A63|nr:uncharacterized protein LOC131298349 [Rhododendron vialii]
MPDLDENDPFKREIRKSFQMFPQLPNNLLVGVRVVEVFLLPNLLEEAYESTALILLRRYFNGEAAQHVIQELVADLVPGIAQSYFGGKLRIDLAENEEYVLLLMGLNGYVFGRVQEAMNYLEEAELLSCLSRIFIAAVDYFNAPEVICNGIPNPF